VSSPVRTSFDAACVQLRSGRQTEANIAEACALVEEAMTGGADLVVTPECTSLLELDTAALREKTFAQNDDPALKALRALAARFERWLLIGSLPIRLSDRLLANRSFLIAPDGGILAHYDKIHMFDVDLPGGESYRESASYAAGDRAVVVALPWAKLGLSICYDLRFPALYRALAQSGAMVLAVPAAFTRTTGEAHWHVLLRARAVENGAFVLAAGQGGMHEAGRATYGHSLIIDPWGTVLAEAGDEPCVIRAHIDMQAVAEARGRIPSLRHDRPFTVESISANHKEGRKGA
jgi:predicted amidohydrolase